MSFIGKEQPINSHEMSIIETFIGKEYVTLTCKDLTINKVLACLRDHQIDLTCDQMVTTTTSRDPRLPRTYHLVLKGSPEAKYMLYALRVKLSEELRRINVECDTGFHGKGLQITLLTSGRAQDFIEVYDNIGHTHPFLIKTAGGIRITVRYLIREGEDTHVKDELRVELERFYKVEHMEILGGAQGQYPFRGEMCQLPAYRDMILHHSSTMLHAPDPSTTANIRGGLDAAKITGRKREQSGETLMNNIRPSPSKALRLTDAHAALDTSQLAGTFLTERTSHETRSDADAESAATKILTTSLGIAHTESSAIAAPIGSTATGSTPAVAVETELSPALVISTGGTVNRADQLEQDAKIKTQAAREMYAARRAQVEALRAQADDIELQADEQFCADIQEAIALRKRALELRDLANE